MSFMRIAIVAGSAACLAAGAAIAKPIGPGGVRVCNNAKCVGIFDRSALKTFSSFYYGDLAVHRASPPRLGAPAFRLQLGDMVAGLAATRQLDRVLVYGLNCGRFRRGVWYRLPPRAAASLRHGTARLEPVHVKRQIPPSC